MGSLIPDLRHAVRSLRRYPSVTAVAVLCLALGLGATTAIFTVVNAVLLRPLPYPAPDQLVRLYESHIGQPGWHGSVSRANYLDWQRDATAFASLAASTAGSASLQVGGTPERVRTVAATANLFETLGVRPRLGRTFAPKDGRPGAPGVVVLGDALWRTRFGGDPAIVGRTITLDGEPCTVIGVMPPEFSYPATSAVDLWVPMRWTPDEVAVRGDHFLQVIGRLKPSVTRAAALAQMRQIAARLAQQYPDEQGTRTVLVESMHDDLFGRTRPRLLVLLGASGLVLLIACVNVANLLLARAVARRREVAIRTALGAGRGSLIRQFLTESVVLSLAGGALGLVLAVWGVRTLVTLASADIPRAHPVQLDGTVFAFLLAIAILTGIAFGLAPALHGTRTVLRDAMGSGARDGSTSHTQRRLRDALVAAEIALALVLVTGAGLLVKALLALERVPSGLVADHVLTLHVSLAGAKYADHPSRDFYEPVLDRVRALPGVTSAGWTSLLPLQDYWTNGTFSIEGKPPAPRGQEPSAELRVASDGYFAALGIPLREGRAFSEQDAPAATPVAVVNETLARRYFPHESPVGHRLRLADLALTIVGVVGDVRGAGLDRPAEPELYMSLRQSPYVPREMTLVAHTAVPPASIVSPVREAVRAVDPEQAIYDIETMDEVVTRSLSNHRLYTWLLGTFAAIALVLAAAGVYGVTSYLVAQRTRELGIRVALGAAPRSLPALVVRRSAAVALVGTVLGLLGALALTRLLATLLSGVSPTDPAVFAAVAAGLVAIALIASYLPARRATRVDPLIALQSE